MSVAGGHSLGGAFALLMACMARVRMDYDPTTIKCYAFGAPPVLSLSEKTSAQNVMSVSPCCLLHLSPANQAPCTLSFHFLAEALSLCQSKSFSKTSYRSLAHKALAS